jgi:beta-xylosidase
MTKPSLHLKIVLLLGFILLLLSCSQKEEEVYLFSYFMGNGEDGLHLASSQDGMKWEALKQNKSFLTPTAGMDKLMRDPCIIKGGDGLFHMVWTVSWNEKGIGYANSSDLVNWSPQRYLPVMEGEPGTRNCWAPEIFYDDESSQYLIIWASTVPGKFIETDSLSEDGYNHRMYYTTTKDFNTFTETDLFYDNGFCVIDATIISNNGEYIMFLKDETLLPEAKKNIRIARSQDLLGPYSDASVPITDNWVEGPTVIQIENRHIVYFDRYRDHQMGAFASDDLINWTDISDQLSFPDGTRHGTVFKVKKSVLDQIVLETE